MSGGNGVSAPVPQTLTITDDDDDTPVVTLALSPTSIREDDEVSTVTASLSAPSSEAVKVMIAATADSPAVSGDFQIRANTDLTIAAGRTESSGTVTITAVDNTQDAPDKTVTVTASVTGENGVAPPEAETLTIEGNDGTPTVTLKPAPASIGENGGVSRVTALLTAASSERVTVTVSTSPTAPAVETDYTLTGTTLTIDPGPDREHGDGDDSGGEQRHTRAGQDGRGDGVGDGWSRRDDAGDADAHDRGRREDADRQPGADPAGDRGRRDERGPGLPERPVE